MKNIFHSIVEVKSRFFPNLFKEEEHQKREDELRKRIHEKINRDRLARNKN